MAAAELCAFLKDRAEGDLLPLRVQLDAGRRFDLSMAEVEESALKAGLLPLRYRRNRQTLSTEDQLRLFRSRVAVIGCGGLGGYIVEQAARIGVGTLVLVDPDVFEEHNLNRQVLSFVDALGRPKVEVGRERVASINPAVTVFAHQAAFSAENGRELLGGCTAVVDALDSLHVRHALARTCRELELPLVHGAIAGWYGQVALQLPGQDLSALLGPAEGKGVEERLGNPSFTPAAIASLQSAELVKALLGRGTTLAGRALLVNLLDMEFDALAYD